MSVEPTFQRQESVFSLSWGNVLRRFTEPDSSVQEIEHRYRARLLASLLLVFIPLALISIVVQFFTVPGFGRIFPNLLGSLIVLTLAYLLSRSQHYKLGAAITVFIPAFAVFMNLLTDPVNKETYFFVIITVILSSVLFSWRWTAALTTTIIVITIFLVLWVPELTTAGIVTPLGFLFITSGLILVLMRYRDSLESSRRAALALSENRWRMLINQSPFSTVIYTPSGRLQTLNQAAIDLWNLPPQDLEYVRNEYNILEDEQLESKGVLAHIRQGFAGTASTSPPTLYEFKRRGEDGSMITDARWITAHCYPVRDDAGDVCEIVLMHEDITERKEAEETLVRSEIYFRSLIENAMDIVTVLNVDGTVRYQSPAIENILGFSPNELVGLSVFDFIHPDDLPHVEDVFVRHIQLEGPAPQIELRFRHQDGSWRILEVFANNMVNEPMVEGVIINSRDITDRKLAEAREARLWKMLDDSLNEIYIFNAATLRFIQVNQGARDNLGYSMTELAEMTPLDLKPEFSAESFANLVEPLRTAEKEKVRLTTVHQRKDKSLYPVEVHLQLAELVEEQVFVAIVLDVSERRQAEEMIRQQDRLAAVGQLAAGIAHDFNNVMAVIALYSELLLSSSNIDDKEKKQLQKIREQASRAADLTGQILDFSRQSVMQLKSVGLLPFLKEFTELLKRTLSENIKIALDYGDDTYVLNADLTRIQQVMMNLTLNARDAMPDGGELKIGLEQFSMPGDESFALPEMKDGKWLRITVSDTGTGISPDVLPYVYEPFFTTKEPGQGTGLGLAQVYGIVKQHDGYIKVESQVGRGTTFTLFFPAVSLMQSDMKPQATENVTKGDGETILIVEDNESTQAALVDGLESLNYQVLVAGTGKEAVKIIDDHQSDIMLILSDLMMPEMGGMELLHFMRQRGIDVPLILLTGHPLGDKLEELRAEGLSDWLYKPVSLEKLARVVSHALAV